MERQVLFDHYRELQRYVDWEDSDAKRIQAIGPLVERNLAELIDDFYSEINQHADARKVITGGQEQVQRLKGTLRDWLVELFSGNYDADYVYRRWKVGFRHVEIGLKQVYTNVALSRLRGGLQRTLKEHWTGDTAELWRTFRSLDKLLDLDLAIIEDAYQTEYIKRQQQNERLAAIGQVAGGVAHELRNPLNVVKTSVYYLLNAKSLSKEKTAEHFERIQRQVGVADGVITALSDFAKLPLPVLQPFSLEPCLRDALESAYLPSDIQVSIDCPTNLPHVLGDERQISIVFANLIRNARDAMPDGGNLRVSAVLRQPDVEVAITDTGEGIKDEDLSRILEPLFSTKARGIGLGLAISRAILDKHGAELDVESEPGTGSTFRVKITAAKTES